MSDNEDDEFEFNENDEAYSEMTKHQKAHYKEQLNALQKKELFNSHDVQALYMINTERRDWKELTKHLKTNDLVKEKILKKVDTKFRETANPPQKEHIHSIINGIKQIKNKKIRKRYTGIILFTHNLLSKKFPEEDEDEDEDEDENEDKKQDKEQHENEDEDEEEDDDEEQNRDKGNDQNEDEDETEEEEEDKDSDKDEDEDEDKDKDKDEEEEEEEKEEEEEEEEEDEEQNKQSKAPKSGKKKIILYYRQEAKSLVTEVLYFVNKCEEKRKKLIEDVTFCNNGDYKESRNQIKRAVKGDKRAAEWIFSRLQRSLGLMAKKKWNDIFEPYEEKLKDLHKTKWKHQWLPCGFGVGCSNNKRKLMLSSSSKNNNNKRRKIQDRLNQLQL